MCASDIRITDVCVARYGGRNFVTLSLLSTEHGFFILRTCKQHLRS